MYYRPRYIKRKNLRGRGTSTYLPFAADMVWKHTRAHYGGLGAARRGSDGALFLIKSLKRNGRYLPLANSYRKQFKRWWDRLKPIQKSSEITRILNKVQNSRIRGILGKYARNFMRKQMGSHKSHRGYKSVKKSNRYTNTGYRGYRSKYATTIERIMDTRKKLNKKEPFETETAEEIIWDYADSYGGGSSKITHPKTKADILARDYINDKGLFQKESSKYRVTFFNYLKALPKDKKITFIKTILREIEDSRSKNIVKDYLKKLKTSDDDEEQT